MWEQTTLQNVAEQYANVLFCIKTYSKMNVDCHVKPKVILKCLPQWMFFPVHYLCKLDFFGREAEEKRENQNLTDIYRLGQNAYQLIWRQ